MHLLITVFCSVLNTDIIPKLVCARGPQQRAGRVYLQGSVHLHEVFNVEVVQSVPGWWRLLGALGCTWGHLQTHFCQCH